MHLDTGASIRSNRRPTLGEPPSASATPPATARRGREPRPPRRAGAARTSCGRRRWSSRCTWLSGSSGSRNPLVLVAFLGVLFGLAVSAGVDRLERFRIPRGVGAALIVLAFFGLLVGFGAWLAPTLRRAERRAPRRSSRRRSTASRNGSSNGRAAFSGMMLGGRRTAGSADVGATTAAPATPSRRRCDAGAPTQPRRRRHRARRGAAAARTETLRERSRRQLSGVTQLPLSLPHAHGGGRSPADLIIVSWRSTSRPIRSMYQRGMMQLFPHRCASAPARCCQRDGHVLRKWLVTQLIAMVDDRRRDDDRAAHSAA